MYESPIRLIESQLRTEVENEIFRAIREVGVEVDKEELIKALQYDRDQYSKGYADGVKEFAEKITEIFLRYAHLHNYADQARRAEVETADGTKLELFSVWDALSLKKHEMAEYEEMSELQHNIEYIANDRLLTELEKDFRLLVKEMTEGAE